MNQYLLLRDNKQSGPYSFEQLVEKGLKKYDLVWLEGKSAAWRYPGEFDELKPYAPAVEEQPYDRFFKKPGQETTAKKEEVQPQQPVTVQTSENTNKKIFVTMPAGTGQVAAIKPKEEVKPQQQQSKPKEEKKEQAAKSSYLVSEDDDEANSALLKGYKTQKKEADENNNGFLSDYEARKAAYSSKKSNPLKEEAAQPVQKEKVVAAPVTIKADKPAYTNTSKQSSQKKDLKGLFTLPSKFDANFFQDNKTLTRSLLAACLILGGVVIGLIINSGKPHGDTQVLETLVKEIREQNKDKGAVTTPEESSTKEKTREQSRDNSDNRDNLNNYTENSTLPNTSPEPPVRHAINKKENTASQKQPVAVPVSNPGPQEVEPQPAVIETKEKVNQETIEKARRNIYDLVGVEASQYKVGLLGGISDLDITISNNSLYALDQVDVEVKYYGPERKLVKTQTIKFNHVPAGKQRTLEVPRTNRGISIDYSITGINSKALGLAQAGY